MIVYFDTSVLVAYYTPEDRSSAAAAIVAQAELPVISDICIAEFIQCRDPPQAARRLPLGPRG